MPRPIESERIFGLERQATQEIKVDLEPVVEVLGRMSEFSNGKTGGIDPGSSYQYR